MSHVIRWELDRLLASGGTADIWIAHDRVLARDVVVKRLREHNSQQRMSQQRLLREAQITAKLNHPGTPLVLDVHRAGANSYFVMSLIHGETLASKIAAFHQDPSSTIQNQIRPLLELLEHFVDACNTIGFAHNLQIIHRDLKGENVIVGDLGETTVIDWGLAKHLGETEIKIEPSQFSDVRSLRQTQVGTRVGTPGFMAPEQIMGDLPAINERTDVFALSAILYEIVTGQLPFIADSVSKTLKATLDETPLPFAHFGVVWLPELEAICLQGLSKLQTDRFATAADLGAAVQAVIANKMRQQEVTAESQYLFSLTSNLMAITNVTMGVTWANAAFQDQLGLPNEDIIGKTFYDLLANEDVEVAIKAFGSLASGDLTSSQLDVRVIDHNGNPRWIAWTASRTPGENQVYFVGQDVDRQQRESTCSTVLDGVADALVVVDHHRKIRLINQLAESMFGYAAADLLDEPLERLLPTRYRDGHPKLVAGYCQVPEPRSLRDRPPLLALHADGTEFDIRINLQPVRVNEEELVVAMIKPVAY